MYCGSCLRDNTLVRTLRRMGCDVSLVPVYTPIKTDEESVSENRVFVGGLNTYLQHKVPLFRYLPAFLDRWLNHPTVIRKLAGGNVNVKAAELGSLTVATLDGESGSQRKELRELVRWLKEEGRPELINLTNLLIAGFLPLLKKELGIPVVVTLQGDDLFLGELIEPFRSRALEKLRAIAREVDAFVVNSHFYAEKMQSLLGIPDEKFHVVPLGIDTAEFEKEIPDQKSRSNGPPTLGYFARLSPEKGFGVVTDTFLRLRKLPGMEDCRLKAGGWLGSADQDFFDECVAKLESASAAKYFEHIGSPGRKGKLALLHSIDVLCVPTVYEEPKGIFALEALACGKPVVVPEHGAFPELLARTGGGVLVPPNDPDATASAVASLLKDNERAASLGEEGRAGVFQNANANVMAEATLAVYEKVLAFV